MQVNISSQNATATSKMYLETDVLDVMGSVRLHMLEKSGDCLLI